jgi:hypothetical protein
MEILSRMWRSLRWKHTPCRFFLLSGSNVPCTSLSFPCIKITLFGIHDSRIMKHVLVMQGKAEEWPCSKVRGESFRRLQTSYLRHSNVVASIVTRMPFAVAIGIFCGSIKTTQSFSRGDHMWFSMKRRWHCTQRGFLSSESSSAIINVSLLVSCVHCLFPYQTITNTCLVVLILRIGDDSHESRGRGMQDCIVWKEKLAEFQKVRLIYNRTRHLHAWLDSRGTAARPFDVVVKGTFCNDFGGDPDTPKRAHDQTNAASITITSTSSLFVALSITMDNNTFLR